MDHSHDSYRLHCPDAGTPEERLGLSERFQADADDLDTVTATGGRAGFEYQAAHPHLTVLKHRFADKPNLGTCRCT